MNKTVKGTMYAIRGRRPNEWIVSINGIEHSIQFVKDKKDEEPKLYVDDEEIMIPSTMITQNIGIDYPVQIEGRIIHCTYDMENFDIAIKGRYVNSKKKYYPLKGWLFVTVVAILMIIAQCILIVSNISDTLEMIGMCGTFVIVILLTLYLDFIHKRASEE